MSDDKNLFYFEIDPLVCPALVTNLILGVGVELLHGLERSCLGHHREEGGVGGPEVLEQDDAGHHHHEEHQAAALIPWLSLSSLRLILFTIIYQ